MRFEFTELPGERSKLPRPVLPIQFEDIDDAPQRCLVDTGAAANRFGMWLAEAAGIDLAGSPQDEVLVGGVKTTAWYSPPR